MTDDLIYQIALTKIVQVGDVLSKELVRIYGEAEAIFKAPLRHLEKVEGIGVIRARQIKSFNDFNSCEEEIKFILKYKITPLFINGPDYPRRLLNCYDSPTLLYYRGAANLNSEKVISIVGTRHHSDYGKLACEELVKDLRHEKMLIVSGLAFGIDSVAHRAAIKHDLPTVGVLAHGLDRIYPQQNKMLAREMTIAGGLLTEFRNDTKPDKQNFPRRNRIVAGMSDAVIVLESKLAGGSLITAELGNGYNKDVFAFPGRSTDAKSEGCNYLIKKNKASLISSADDLLEMMGWKKALTPEGPKQRKLFVELSKDEETIVSILSGSDQSPIDELYVRSGMSAGSVANVLLMLELNGIINALPGKQYRLA